MMCLTHGGDLLPLPDNWTEQTEDELRAVLHHL